MNVPGSPRPLSGWWPAVALLFLFGTASAQPEQFPLSFRRGDANSDGGVDISDATATFNWLFLEADAPGCLDATDSNDDGEVNITDGIFSLNFLFLEGAPIPAPGNSACGLDPTADELGCLAYEPCICGGFAGKPCEEGQVCDTFPIDCSGADLQGICVPLPEACPEIFQPVCGCDGVTYSSDCERLRAGVQRDHEGPCGASLEFRTLARDDYSGARPQTTAIRDLESWEAFWFEHGSIFEPAPEMPVVDFDSEMVIAVVGAFTSGGYHLKIDSIVAAEGALWVFVTQVEPSEDCATTDALTQPHHVVVLEGTTGALVPVKTTLAVCCAYPMDARGVGACEMFMGYRWNGQGCEGVSGCECEGEDCDELFASPGECAAAYNGCPTQSEEP